MKTKDGVKTGVIKKTPKHQFTEDDKHLYNLHIHAWGTIGNSLPYDIYHLVQNCISAKEVINMLNVAYEGTK